MHIHEYISNGIVLKRLQNKLTESELSEFNALADLHPELREELVYAYHLLAEVSASVPPEMVSLRFRAEYNGHLKQYHVNPASTTVFTPVKDLSNRYAFYHKNYRTAFYSYLVLLAVLMILTAYFYLHSR